ncbi:MAG: FtsX-like permease family protein [Phycisphaerales bacterium]
MSAGLRIAINGLATRFVRTALLIVAVAFAVSLAVSVSISISTVDASLRASLADMLGRSEVRIRRTTQGAVPGEVLDTVDSWPEVEIAAPRLSETVAIRTHEGEDLSFFVTAHGVDFEREAKVHPVRMESGRWPSGEGEALIDPRIAFEFDVGLGDRLIVGGRFDRRVEVEIVGIHERVSLAILQKPEIRIAHESLREIKRRDASWTTIDLILGSGASIGDLIEQRSDALPTAIEMAPSELIASGLDDRLRGSLVLKIVTATLAAIAAAFIVLTGMTTAVTEQIRTLATMRCVGASRLQIFASQVIAGGVIGGAGAALGAPLGVLFAWLLIEAFRYALRVSLQVEPSAIVSGIVVGLGAGFVGAALPALSASRVTPLDALRIHARPMRRGWLFALGVLGVGTVTGSAALLRSIDDPELALLAHVAVVVPGVVIGWFILGPSVYALVSLLFARPMEWLFRVPRESLRGSAGRTPYRHGFTAGALMLGYAVMISVWANGTGLLTGWVDRIEFPDAFIVDLGGLTDEDLTTVRSLPFVRSANPIGQFKIETDRQIFGVEGIAPRSVFFISFEPGPFFEMTRLEWHEGDREAALRRLEEGDALLVAREFLVARGIGHGDTLELGPPDNRHSFEVVGVVSSPGLDIATTVFGIEGEFHQQAIHSVFGSRADAAAKFDHRQTQLIQFDLDESITDEEARERLRSALGAVQFSSGRLIKETVNELSTQLMRVASILAVLAMAVASLGVANVMAANVASRRFEYGVFRAVGAGRGVLIRLVLGEATLIALAAVTLGGGLGYTAALNETVIYRVLVGIDVPALWPMAPAIFGALAVLTLAAAASMPPILSMAGRSPGGLLFGR